jgi:hypothetical protein
MFEIKKGINIAVYRLLPHKIGMISQLQLYPWSILKPFRGNLVGALPAHLNILDLDQGDLVKSSVQHSPIY